MRRWIAILLLCWLPLQSLWAAAAPYCQHEDSAQATHLGHHQHEHVELFDGDLPSPDDQTSNADHADCHACHGHCAAVPQFTGLTQTVTPNRGLMPAGDVRVPAAPVALPDRPNWPSLA
ncbi:MAG: hypothetical protein IT506_10035 [Aquabacterium sp.]|nr:hypothetical protein [Aquabacterium sp.]